MSSLAKLKSKYGWEASNEGVDPPERLTTVIARSNPTCWIACCRHNLKGKCTWSRIPRSVSCAKAYHDEINL